MQVVHHAVISLGSANCQRGAAFSRQHS